MLSPSDVIVLPLGVHADEGALVDDVRGESFALNAAGRDVVLCDGRPLAEAAERVRQRWGLPEGQAERDVLAFAWVLNRAFLANILRAGPPPRRLVEWLVLAARLLPLGIAPPILARRYDLDTSTRRRALADAVGAVWPRCVLVGATTLVASFPVLVDPNRSTAEAWIVVGVAAGVALACHEVGHVLALRGIPAALVSTGVALSVLHSSTNRRRAAVVGLAGPAFPASLAVVTMTIALLVGSSLAGMAACPFAAHALTATLAGRDGRNACRS